MIPTLFTLAISLASLSYGSAIHAQRDSGSGILRLPVTAVKDVTKRQIVSTIENIMTGTRYLVELSIGSPPQHLLLTLDTGSSETWVNPRCSAVRNPIDAELCRRVPTYMPNASSTALDLQQTKDLRYARGTARIQYYSDSIELGGATITGQQFGRATMSSDLAAGFMGIGPGIELTGYPSIIDTLTTQNVTNSRAFSLDLRSWDSPDGSIIFGGIDTAKYSGSLAKCPIIPPAQAPDRYLRYWIHMKSVGITKPGEVSSQPYALSSSDPLGQPVFLDSGGTLTRLPTALFNSIVADFPSATEDGNTGLYLVDCSVADQAGTVDFGFGDTIINVPFAEFLWRIQGLCYLGVVADDRRPLLGASFLKAAFVVYDQDNQNLHLANAGNCGTSLVAIGTGPNAVPSIVGQCSPSSSSSSVSAFAILSSNSTGLYPMLNHSSTAEPTAYPATYATPTAYSTSKYTITSCPASVTNCPTGKVTHAPTMTSKPSYDFHTTEKTNTIYATRTYSISMCAPGVKGCPYGSTAATVTPVSISVHQMRYAVVTVAGYTVAPYELVVDPAPFAPAIPIQFPVPVKPVPIGVKPGSHNPATTPAYGPGPVHPPSEGAAPYPKVGPAASYVPNPTAASDFHTYSAVPSISLLQINSGIPYTGAASSIRVGNLWAVAAIALGYLVMI